MDYIHNDPVKKKPYDFPQLSSRQIATFANWLTRKGKRQLFLIMSYLYFSIRESGYFKTTV